MLINLNPCVAFIDDKFINVKNLDSFSQSREYLFIELVYSAGFKDLIRFGSIKELDRAVMKLSNAMQSLDFGSIHG